MTTLGMFGLARAVPGLKNLYPTFLDRAVTGRLDRAAELMWMFSEHDQASLTVAPGIR
jgi:hypothetical protein